MTKVCGDGVKVTQETFLFSDGGANPTSPLQTCSEISYGAAYELVSKYHYLGSTRFIGQFCFGLVEGWEIVGAVVYSPLSVPNSAQSAFGLPRGSYPDLLEMSRMVLKPDLNGTNAGSKLIGYSLRALKKKNIRAVITYADSSRHYGAIYQACNFTYHGLTPQKNDFYFADGRKLTRGKSKGFDGKWVPRSRKHRYLYIFDKNLKSIWPQDKFPKEK